MEDTDKLAIVSLPSLLNREDFECMREFLKKNQPKGWHFIMGTDFHALSKDEVETLYAHLGVILEK